MALQKGKCRLAEILLSKGMSQVEFAKRMDVTESTVSRWKTGTTEMSFNHAVQAGRILHCSPEDLYDWIEV